MRLVVVGLFLCAAASFRDRLLGWRHCGFSVYGAQALMPEKSDRVAHFAR